MSSPNQPEATPTCSRAPRRGLCGLLLGLLLLLAGPAAAWDSFGHRVIARLAWDQLTPATRQQVLALLAHAPTESGLRTLRPRFGRDPDRSWFELASLWPDLVKGDARWDRSSWHYVNQFWEPSSEDPAGRLRPDLLPEEDNLLRHLPEQLARLRSRATPDPERAVALAWVLHLVGDLHQPLHTTARVTALEPRGDRGGNDFPLAPEPGDPQPQNLHRLWDRLLSARFPARRFESQSLRVGRAVAALRSAHRSSPAGLSPDFEAWAREGLALSRQHVYGPGLARGQAPSAAYLEQAYEAAAPAIRRAGDRLARLLEDSFDRPTP
jgi:S1/P1 Nuclease